MRCRLWEAEEALGPPGPREECCAEVEGAVTNSTSLSLDDDSESSEPSLVSMGSPGLAGGSEYGFGSGCETGGCNDGAGGGTGAGTGAGAGAAEVAATGSEEGWGLISHDIGNAWETL